MDHLPLTCTAPFEEIPLNPGMDPLFDELAPLARAPFEVTVTAGRDGGRRCLMDLIVAEDDVRRAFAVAFEQGGGLEDFEVTVRRHRA
jgi:hypothetical protein